MDVSREVTRMFMKMTPDEVAEKERALHLEIDQKQVQLRKLVAERYRDLVDCSEPLKLMHSEARRVVQRIEHVRGAVKHGNQGDEGRSVGNVSAEKRRWADHLRVAMESRGRAWRAAGKGEWEKAAKEVLEGERCLKEAQSLCEPGGEKVTSIAANEVKGGREGLRRGALAELRKGVGLGDVVVKELRSCVNLLDGEEQGRKAVVEGRGEALREALKKRKNGGKPSEWALVCGEVLADGVADGWEAEAERVAQEEWPLGDVNFATEPVLGFEDLSSILEEGSARYGEEGLWGKVLGTRTLQEMRRSMRAYVEHALENVWEAQLAESACAQWSGEVMGRLRRCKGRWALEAQQYASQCVKEALQKLQQRWDDRQKKRWDQRDQKGWEQAAREALETAREMRALVSSTTLRRLQSGDAADVADAVSGGIVGMGLSRVARAALQRALPHAAPRDGPEERWWCAWAHLISKAPSCVPKPPIVVTVAPSDDLAQPLGATYPSSPSPSCVDPIVELCKMISQCNPPPPSWACSLLVLLIQRTASPAWCKLPFSPVVHMDLLFLDAVLSPTASLLPIARSTTVALGLVDPFLENEDVHPFLRGASAIAASADPIDAAYAQLKGPPLAAGAAHRMRLLLNPLLPSSSTSSTTTLDANPLIMTARPEYPFRSLPVASARRLAEQIQSTPDDDDDEDTPQKLQQKKQQQQQEDQKAQKNTSSLFQRLGSQLW